MTIRNRLISGFSIVLLLMVAMGVSTYFTLSSIHDKSDSIKDYTVKLSLVNELQQSVSPWLVTNDFLITGAFQLEGFFEALSKSLFKKINDVENIAQSDEEKTTVKKIKEKFVFIKDNSKEILRLVDSSGPLTSVKKMDMIINLRYAIRQTLKTYEYIVSGDVEEKIDFEVICKIIKGLAKEIYQYPFGIHEKNLLDDIMRRFSFFNNNVQKLIGLNLQDPFEDNHAMEIISKIDTMTVTMIDNIGQLLEYTKSEIGPVATMMNVVRDPRTIELTLKTDAAAEAMVKNVELLSKISKNYLNLAIAESDRDKKLGSIVTLVLCILAVAIGLGVAIVLSRGITKPVTSLVSAAGAIAKGDLTGKVGIVSKDEIGNLADSFNRMTTNLKKSSDDLKHSEERYRDLIENSPEIIYQTDKDRFFVGINRTMLSKLEYLPETLKKLRVEDLVPAKEHEKLIKHIQKVVENGSDSIETEFLTKKREIVNVEINATAMYNSDNDFVQTRAFAHDITARKKAEAAEKHGKDLELLSSQTISIQEEERRRISRELHDEVGQTLTAMRINIELMEIEIPENLPKLKQRLGDTKQLLSHTLNEIRSLSFELRPSLLDHFGILAAIRGYSKNYSARTNISVEVEGGNMVDRFPTEIEILFYRCAQEALNNVAKHSQANNVEINISYGNNELRMKVKDDGKGFDVKDHFEKKMSGTSIGLFGMKERVALMNGNLEINSEKGKGTELEVVVYSNKIDKNSFSEAI